MCWVVYYGGVELYDFCFIGKFFVVDGYIVGIIFNEIDVGNVFVKYIVFFLDEIFGNFG